MRALFHASIGIVALLPLQVRSHAGELDWHVPPSDSLLVLLPLLATTGLYLAGLLRRVADVGLQPNDALRSAVFASGVVLLALALVWPLDAWAATSFAAHMVQHIVLAALAPLLLLLGRPYTMCLRGLPRGGRAWVLRPRHWPGARLLRRVAASATACAALHGLMLWGWHLPVAFELALRHEFVHWLEHLTLLGSGVLFWRAILRARGAALGTALLAALFTIIHSGMLGALLALAPQVIYVSYARTLGPAEALADQQLAGLIMWIPMGTLYLLAGLALAARGLWRTR